MCVSIIQTYVVAEPDSGRASLYCLAGIRLTWRVAIALASIPRLNIPRSRSVCRKISQRWIASACRDLVNGRPINSTKPFIHLKNLSGKPVLLHTQSACAMRFRRCRHQSAVLFCRYETPLPIRRKTPLYAWLHQPKRLAWPVSDAHEQALKNSASLLPKRSSLFRFIVGHGLRVRVKSIQTYTQRRLLEFTTAS